MQGYHVGAGGLHSYQVEATGMQGHHVGAGDLQGYRVEAV